MRLRTVALTTGTASLVAVVSALGWMAYHSAPTAAGTIVLPAGREVELVAPALPPGTMAKLAALGSGTAARPLQVFEQSDSGGRAETSAYAAEVSPDRIVFTSKGSPDTQAATLELSTARFSGLEGVGAPSMRVLPEGTIEIGLS